MDSVISVTIQYVSGAVNESSCEKETFTDHR